MHRPVRQKQIGGTNSVGVVEEYQETGSLKRRWRRKAGQFKQRLGMEVKISCLQKQNTPNS